jgi:hypothetical protein
LRLHLATLRSRILSAASCVALQDFGTGQPDGFSPGFEFAAVGFSAFRHFLLPFTGFLIRSCL